MPAGTRDRVLDAALRLFAENGFAGTSVSQIEAASGLASGSGSFYRHFKSKEDVFLAVIGRELAEVKSVGPPRTGDVATDVLDGLRLMRERSALIAVLLRDGRRFPEIAAGISEWHDVSGGGSQGDPVAAVVFAATIGFHFATLFTGTPPGGITADTFAQTIAGMAVQE